MTNVAVFFLGVFLCVPLLVYVILFSLIKGLIRNHKRSVKFAVYGTTPFAFGAVYFSILSIWNVSLLWLMLIGMAIMGISVVSYLWRQDADLHWSKIVAGFWGLNFVLFMCCHALLVTYGVSREVFLAIVR
ncbi:DUF3397 domain-containing protein [Jeotgalibacillus marinus]|uniref:DUF3397 domain-containing protein n=1 Tax=Jeotgalibacillus marinus TaxID=86667 RepID=A0ABV3Q258_9BACL